MTSSTFDVLYLGNLPLIDPTEGNTDAEDASLLVGMTLGSAAAPLLDEIRTLSPTSPGTMGATYDQDNSGATDGFQIDGGASQNFDAQATYSATITYDDGSTATITAVVFQDDAGNTYLAPPLTAGADLTALEAGPIQSLTLDSLVGSTHAGLTAARQAPSFETGDETLEGTTGADTIDGGGGDDWIFGDDGDDSLIGGSGNDVIYGDGSFETIDPVVTDNITATGSIDATDILAVELVTLANGNLILITSDMGFGSWGIGSYQIDNDPASASYGQVVGGQIDTVVGGVDGYLNISDMEAVTLSNGSTYVYSVSPTAGEIAVTEVASDGTLTNTASITGLGNAKELTLVESGGSDYLISLTGTGAANMTVYEIGTDGSLTQTDQVTDGGTGAGQNFILDYNTYSNTLLESFTASNGETYVLNGGTSDGIALWTLDGTGSLTLQNARADNQAGAGDTDTEGNDLGRDLISPSGTNLNAVQTGAFAEIDGQVYAFVGGNEDGVDIFRIDADAVNGDGTWDLTLVGMLDSSVANIASMEYIEGSNGDGVLAVGGSQASLVFYDITVNPDGTVDLDFNSALTDDGTISLDNSTDMDIEGGILVSGSDSDDGVAIIDTGVGPLTEGSGADTIDGGIGDDTIYGGDGSDWILLNDDFGNDEVFGGDDGGVDVLDASGITSSSLTLTYTGDGAGTLTDSATGDVVTFAGIEQVILSDQADTVDGTAATGGFTVDTGGGADSVLGGSGNDSITTGSGADRVDAGSGTNSISTGTGGDTVYVGESTASINTGSGGDTVIVSGDFDNINATLDGGSGDDRLELTPDDNRDLTVDLPVGEVRDGTFGVQEFQGFEDIVTGGGNDSIIGDANDTTLSTGTGTDTVDAGDGADTVYGGDGDDSLAGGAGDDFLDGGDGDDRLVGGFGSDSFNLNGQFGSDSITGGDEGGDTDYISLSGATNGVNVVHTGDERGTITDAVTGDIANFEEIESLILSNNGDTLDASGDSAGVLGFAGAGDDTLQGGLGSDTFYAGADADTIDGGIGDDHLFGEQGDDVLTGGSGNDTFYYFTGDGNETITDFNAGNTGTITDGDKANNDFIDLQLFYDSLYELWADQADDGVLNQSNATDTQGNAVNYADNTSFGSGSLTFTGASADNTFFTADNTNVMCFTPGTRIRTLWGETPVEEIRPGTMVITKDNGVKPVLWVGTRTLGADRLGAEPRLRPVQIKARAFGLERDMVVSPQHGLLLPDGARGGGEMLYRATHLAALKGGAARVMEGCREVTYIHLLFDRHEVIFADGGASESLYPGRMSLEGLSPAALSELQSLFPDLGRAPVEQVYGRPARSYSRRNALPTHLAELVGLADAVELADEARSA